LSLSSLSFQKKSEKLGIGAQVLQKNSLRVLLFRSSEIKVVDDSEIFLFGLTGSDCSHNCSRRACCLVPRRYFLTVSSETGGLHVTSTVLSDLFSRNMYFIQDNLVVGNGYSEPESEEPQPVICCDFKF
jgi:hypothetical protein